jgi:hypothetical protein
MSYRSHVEHGLTPSVDPVRRGCCNFICSHDVIRLAVIFEHYLECIIVIVLF